MRDAGGFDHNLYGLRRVDVLEDRYPDFPGLNLSFETREAFVRHAKSPAGPEAAEFAGLGAPLLEAQLADAADSLAYDAHDTDDAVGVGLVTLDELDAVPLWRRVAGPVRRKYPALRGDSFRAAVIRDLIALQVGDLVAETERRLRDARIGTAADVRGCPTPLVGFGGEMAAWMADLERYLRSASTATTPSCGWRRRGGGC